MESRDLAFFVAVAEVIAFAYSVHGHVPEHLATRLDGATDNTSIRAEAGPASARDKVG